MCLQSGSNSLLSAEKTDLSRLLLHLLRPKTTCNEISLWFFCPILAVSSYKFWLYHHIKSDYLPAKTNLQTKNPDLKKKTPFRDMAGFQLWFLFSVFFFPEKEKILICRSLTNSKVFSKGLASVFGAWAVLLLMATRNPAFTHPLWER